MLKYNLYHLYGFARAAARKQGYMELELWTDREIKACPRLSNADLVAAARTSYVDLSYELAMRSAIAELAQLSSALSREDVAMGTGDESVARGIARRAGSAQHRV